MRGDGHVISGSHSDYASIANESLSRRRLLKNVYNRAPLGSYRRQALTPPPPPPSLRSTPVAKLTPGSVSYYVVKIRGKLESGLAVKTVSITVGASDTGGSGEGESRDLCNSLPREGVAFTSAQRNNAASRSQSLREYFSAVIF